MTMMTSLFLEATCHTSHLTKGKVSPVFFRPARKGRKSVGGIVPLRANPRVCKSSAKWDCEHHICGILVDILSLEDRKIDETCGRSERQNVVAEPVFVEKLT
jgi:hypothetical protein